MKTILTIILFLPVLILSPFVGLIKKWKDFNIDLIRDKDNPENYIKFIWGEIYYFLERTQEGWK